MSQRNLRPKSNLPFLKPTKPERAEKTEIPKKVEKKLANTEIESLKNIVKELQGRLERSEEENSRKDREVQSLEEELQAALTELICTKKKNDSLVAQLKMQQYANECLTLPLLVDEKFPTDNPIAIQNVDGALSDQRKPHECVPVSEEAFVGWDKSLGNQKDFASMRAWYLDKNLKDIKQFIKQCIIDTFSQEHIPKIHFEKGNAFNDSNILRCLIETIQEKFKEKNLDDKEARKEIVTAFRRFRDNKPKAAEKKF